MRKPIIQRLNGSQNRRLYMSIIALDIFFNFYITAEFFFLLGGGGWRFFPIVYLTADDVTLWRSVHTFQHVCNQTYKALFLGH